MIATAVHYGTEGERTSPSDDSGILAERHNAFELVSLIILAALPPAPLPY